MEVAMRITNLRIEIAGEPINEYRIRDHVLEFRTLDSTGHSFSDPRSRWKRLTASELLLHFRLNTVVAHWSSQRSAEWESETTNEEGQKAAQLPKGA